MRSNIASLVSSGKPNFRHTINAIQSQLYRQSLASDTSKETALFRSLGTQLKGRNSMNIQIAQQIIHNIDGVHQEKKASSYSNIKSSLAQISQKLKKAQLELNADYKNIPSTCRSIESKERVHSNNKTPNKNQETSTICTLSDKQSSHKNLHKLTKFNNIKKYYIEELSQTISGDNPRALDHLTMSLNVFKNLSHLKSPTFADIQQRKIHLPRRAEDFGKMTLILDIDQTLIHCEQNPILPFDTILPIETANGLIAQAFIGIRPYAISFLKRMSKHFEIIAFTASHQSYADVVLDQLDPNHEYIRHRLYRKHCYQVYENLLVKDLRIIDRDLSKMVLVDNAPYSYIFQPENGIPILPFYSGEDSELYKLEKYLIQLVKCQDVRENNKKAFKLHQYSGFVDPKSLVQQLYLSQS